MRGRTLGPAPRHFLPDGAKVVGTDIDPGFAEQAQTRAQELGLKNYTGIAAPAEKLPFDDNSFDVVTCQTVLIHVADVPKALQEACGSSSPGASSARRNPTTSPAAW